MPLIRALVERCGEAGAYVHWGATTQDIIDTGAMLQVRAATRLIRDDVAAAAAAAERLASRHRDDPMPGRTHGQHAVPIAFGQKAASWADELQRCVARLDRLADEVACVQLGGAAGSLAALGDDAAAVRARFAANLGLPEPAVAWHAARDRIREIAHVLSQIAAAGERIAAEVVRLQATEVAELREPAAAGHVGSSTMPQKRNPMTSEYLIASARLVHASTSVLNQSGAHAGERDMGLWAVEWIALPEALILTAGAASKLAWILQGLEVDTARMRVNLDADSRCDHGRGGDDGVCPQVGTRGRPPDGGAGQRARSRRRPARWTPRCCWIPRWRRCTAPPISHSLTDDPGVVSGLLAPRPSS